MRYYFLLFTFILFYSCVEKITDDSLFIERALLNIELTDTSSKQLGECQYLESLVFRLGDKIEEEFDSILKGINLKY